MAHTIQLKVWGEYACFTRPEMKVERVSYDIITPAAARGILEAIYWKPEFRWVIDAVHVLNPIRFTHVRRNEIDAKIPVKGKTGVAAAMKAGTGALGLFVDEHRQQRAAMILRDVAYGIVAHVHVLVHDDPGTTNPAAKHLEVFKRRAARGQYFHHPYLGTREFPAFFEICDQFPPCPETLRGVRDLGLILHDIDFVPDPRGHVIESNRGRRLRAEPRFFHAVMVDGVVRVPPLEHMQAGSSTS